MPPYIPPEIIPGKIPLRPRLYIKRRTPSPFKGEMMTCNGCGKMKRNTPDKATKWIAHETKDVPPRFIYVCPQCNGADPAYWDYNEEDELGA